jgi:D-alanyl-D-alanine carboxypeptidase
MRLPVYIRVREDYKVVKNVSEPPEVSAQSWSIVDGNTGDIIFANNQTERREIASLTKIMTIYTVLSISKRLNINLEEDEITVSKSAVTISGTKAFIKEGDVFKANDLLYGLMLPSGNDVGKCFCEHFGLYLAKEFGQETNSLMLGRKHFVYEMNKNAKALGMVHTRYDNPTGLGDIYNKSTVEDLGKLCSAAMKLPKFREVVSCKEYSCVARTEEGKERQYSWKNTNKMLEKGYNGIKTGITPSAGPCLASSIETKGYFLIIILLKSKTTDIRWEETEALTNWTLKELGAKK